MSDRSRSYYAVLGVRPDATPAAIRDAYRAKARQLHPDSTSGSGSPEAMRELNEAWRVLGDPVKKERYDQQRRGSSGVRIPHQKQHWSPLDHGFDEDEQEVDYDDLDPGRPLDPRSTRVLRFLTVGAVGTAIGACVLFALSLLLEAGQFASMGIVVLGISIGSFTMAPLYAMSRSGRKHDG